MGDMMGDVLFLWGRMLERACGVEALARSLLDEVAVKLVVFSGHGPWMESPWEAR